MRITFGKLKLICLKFRYLLLLFILVVTSLLLLELKTPYFFLQDDNRTFYFPMYLHSYRSLLNGELAFFNFHQFLGTPFFSNGQSAVLYPLNYAGYFLSKVMFGHYFAAIDIIVIIHLLIAAAGCFYLVKSFGLGNRSALFGALTWSLCSYVIYMSDSWVIVSGASAYFPWMLFFGHKLFKSPSIKCLGLLTLMRLLLFYIGHPQFFIYAVIFEVLTVLLIAFKKCKTGIISKKELKKPLLYYMMSFILTLFLSLPLLLPMWHHMNLSYMRSAKLGFDEYSKFFYHPLAWLIGLVFPYLRPQTIFFHLSFVGYITLIFTAVILIRKYSVFKTKYQKVHLWVFSRVLLVAFLWATGPLAIVIYIVPVLNRFRFPFKIQPYVSFYFILLACIGLNLWFKKRSFNLKTKNVVFMTLILLQTLNFSLMYLLKPQVAIGPQPDKIPYNETLKDVLSDGRIATLKFNTLKFNTIGYNYATIWELYQFGGYDPMQTMDQFKTCLELNRESSYGKTESDIPLEYFRRWGVKWYIRDSTVASVGNSELTQVYSDKGRIVLYDPKAKPLVYWSGSNDNEIIKQVIMTNSISLKVANRINDTLNINFLYNPFFIATLDGKATAVSRNEYNQMQIYLPQGTHEIRLEYRDPYFYTGCYTAMAFVLFMMVLYALFRFNKWRKIEK